LTHAVVYISHNMTEILGERILLRSTTSGDLPDLHGRVPLPRAQLV